MKKFKKIMSFCLTFVIIVAAAVASILIFDKTKSPLVPDGSSPIENQVNYDDLGVHFASANEDSGAESAPIELKGGCIVIGNGNRVQINNTTVEYHEGLYGGAFYVQAGGVLEINGGAIRNNGAKYGGAIYIEYGGKCIINGGAIENNSAEYGAAIWCAPKPDAVGDEGQNYDALVLGENVSLSNIISKNFEAEYGLYDVNYYIDDVLVKKVTQKAGWFKTDKAPVDYNNSIGWFLNDNYTTPIEEGDVFKFSDSNKDDYKSINVYSKVATPNSCTFEIHDNLYYTLTGVNDQSATILVPKTVNDIPVLNMNDYAFQYNQTLEHIYLPSGISRISQYAFEESNIKSINITDNITTIDHFAFFNSTITNVVISENSKLNIIETNAFHHCTSLTQITIPRSVTFVGHRAFRESPNIERVDITDLNRWLSISFHAGNSNPLYAGESELYLNGELVTDIHIEGITKIAAHVFVTYNHLKTVTMSNEITDIGESAFDQCENLVSVELSTALNTLGRAAFNKCSSLKNITIPKNVQTILPYTFFACTSLESVSYATGSMLNTIQTSAFQNCISLKSNGITTSSVVTTFQTSCFQGCSSLEQIILPNSTYELYASAFNACTNVSNILYASTNLEEIINSSSNISAFTSVGNNTTCTLTFAAIMEYTLPDNIFVSSGIMYVDSSAPLRIGSHAFSNSKKLKNLNCPISYAEGGAFKDCTSLQSIELYGSNIASTAFSGCTNIESAHISYDLENEGIFENVGTNTGFTATFASSTTIPNNTFKNSGIISINVSSSENFTIGDCAFIGCTKFTGFVNQNSSIPVFFSHIGNSAFQNCSNLENISLDSTSTIYPYAFYGCSKLSNVTFSSSLENISTYAFYGCSSLQALDFRGSSVSIVYPSAFANCTSLQSVFFNSYLTSIENSAFYGCTSLQTIDYSLSQSITTLGFACFQGCTSLTSITIPESITNLSGNAFRDCTNVSVIFYRTNKAEGQLYDLIFGRVGENSESCTLILGGDVSSIFPYTIFMGASLKNIIFGSSNITQIGTLKDFTELKSVDLSNSKVKTINAFAFDGCSSLESIYFNSAQETIGSSAFAGCTKLNVVDLENATNLKTIGTDAFKGCSILQSIDFSNTKITSIPSQAFRECVALENVTLPQTITSIDASSFYNCSALTTFTTSANFNIETIGDYAFYNCSKLSNIPTSSKLKTIGQYAFYRCTGLASADLLNTPIESIGAYSFYETSLNTLKLPDTLKTIAHYAFYNAIESAIPSTGLPDLVWPNPTTSSLTSIGANAFEKCYFIQTIVIPKSVTSIGDLAFLDCNEVTRIDYYAINANDKSSTYFAPFKNIGSNTSQLTLNIGEEVERIPACMFTSANITELNIPDDAALKTIGQYTFQSCTSLSYVNLSWSIEKIERAAFAGCSNITSVWQDPAYEYPFAPMEIETYAFLDCNKLVNIELSFKKIYNDAFLGCNNIQTIVILSAYTTISVTTSAGEVIAENVASSDFRTYFDRKSYIITFN